MKELKDAQAHFVHLHEASLESSEEDEGDQLAHSELKGALEVLLSVLNTLTALNKVEGISDTAAGMKKVIEDATIEAKR